MGWILKEQWYWIIILSVILVLIVPLAIVWLILELPPVARLVVTIAVIVAWGIIGGYKDWLMSRRKEEEKQA